MSYHQAIFFHRSMHAWAVSLNSRRSSKVQGCARSVHCNMWDVFSVARPHSHVVSPLKYPHFFLCSLLQVYPVLSLFRHLQLSQGLSCPVTRSSYRLTKPACAFSSSLLFHSLTRTTFAGKWTGWTLVRKLLLDFRRLLAGVCPNREWVSLSTCLVLSTLAHTLLLISGGAIPASKYKFSTFVGLRHPVMARHAWFNSGFSRCA